jgi:hypothetical protein
MAPMADSGHVAAIRIGELLVQAGLLDDTSLRSALREARARRLRLGESLIATGRLSEQQMVTVLARHLEVPVVKPEELDAGSPAHARIPADLAQRLRVVPLAVDGRLLWIATDDPTTACVDAVRMHTGLDVRAKLATPTALTFALARHYGGAVPASLAAPSRRPQVAAPASTRMPLKGVRLRWPRAIALRRDRMAVVEGRDLVMSLALADDGTPQIRDARPVGWSVGAIRLSPTGRHLMVSSTAGTWLEIRNPDTGDVLGTLNGPDRVVATFAFLDDDEVVVVSRRPGVLEAYTLPSLTPVFQTKTPSGVPFVFDELVAMDDGNTLGAVVHPYLETRSTMAFLSLSEVVRAPYAVNERLSAAMKAHHAGDVAVGPCGWDSAVSLEIDPEGSFPGLHVVKLADGSRTDYVEFESFDDNRLLMGTSRAIAVGVADGIHVLARGADEGEAPRFAPALAYGFDTESGRAALVTPERDILIVTLPRD